MRYDAEAEQRKKGAMARIMSGSGSMAKRTGGVSPAAVLGLLDNGSPMDGAIGFSRQNNALNKEIFADHGGFNAGLAAGVKTMPKDSGGGGGQITVQASPTPAVKPADRTPVTSDRTREDVLKAVLEANGVTLPPTPETPGAAK